MTGPVQTNLKYYLYEPHTEVSRITICGVRPFQKERNTGTTQRPGVNWASEEGKAVSGVPWGDVPLDQKAEEHGETDVAARRTGLVRG